MVKHLNVACQIYHNPSNFFQLLNFVKICIYEEFACMCIYNFLSILNSPTARDLF